MKKEILGLMLVAGGLIGCGQKQSQTNESELIKSTHYHVALTDMPKGDLKIDQDSCVFQLPENARLITDQTDTDNSHRLIYALPGGKQLRLLHVELPNETGCVVSVKRHKNKLGL